MKPFDGQSVSLKGPTCKPGATRSGDTTDARHKNDVGLPSNRWRASENTKPRPFDGN